MLLYIIVSLFFFNSCEGLRDIRTIYFEEKDINSKFKKIVKAINENDKDLISLGSIPRRSAA